MINYSIIIPHYNIPKLLQRLLNSIPRREDIEVIIVDDNSNPDIVDFSRFPGIKRDDVKVFFDKKGGGGGYARNVGLKHAIGKWILFADADDFFNYCFNDVLNEYLDSSNDIIYFKANSVDSVYYTCTFRTGHLNRFIDGYLSGNKKDDVNLRYLFGEPWCKLIKKNIITDNKIQFDETSIHNDTTFSYMCGYHANKITVDKRAIYCVTSREGSVSKQISETKKLERIKVFTCAYAFFKGNNINVVEERHFQQLYKCKRENSSTYTKGMNFMLTHGITANVIKFHMLKQFLYNSFPCKYLKKLKQFLKKVILKKCL